MQTAASAERKSTLKYERHHPLKRKRICKTTPSAEKKYNHTYIKY